MNGIIIKPKLIKDNTHLSLPPTRMLRLASFFLIFILLSSAFSCKEDPIQPKNKATLAITIEDVSCTEAWMKLTASNLQLPTSLNLLKDNNIIKTINLQTTDTLIYIASLLPNQTYNFQITGIGNPVSGIKSNIAMATTLDTTSHNFTWQTFEFGQNSSSTLYDVAIIDENNIWVVGEIYLNDSLGNPDPNAYNAVHWDGNEWKLFKFQFYTFCGQTHTGSYPVKSIFAFNENEIFISSGSQITEISGINQGEIQCLPVSVNKLWGTNRNNLYAVGFNGQIGHYNGSGWRRIESGTILEIYDIYGDSSNDENEIVLIAAQHLMGPERKILSLKNNSVNELPTSNIPNGSLYGVWFKSGRKYFVAGNGIYNKFSITSTDSWIPLHNGLTNYYTYAIRGSALNNIFICGSFGETLHFNGVSWQSYHQTPGFSDIEFLRTAVTHNIIVAVGYSGNKGSITLAKREN